MGFTRSKHSGRIARLARATNGWVIACAVGTAWGLAGNAVADSPHGEQGHSSVVAALEGQAPQSTRAARLRARLIERNSGEWVIANVEMNPSGPAGALAGTASTAQVDTRFQRVIDEYERAFDERDPSRLARVWLMNPAERAQVEKLFGGSQQIRLSIDNARVTQTGGDAVVEFDQVVEVWKRPFRRSARRSMAASDNYGDWDLSGS